MSGWSRRLMSSYICVIIILAPTWAFDPKAAIVDIRAKFAQAGSQTIELIAKKVPFRDKAWTPTVEIEQWLKQQPKDLIREAVDQVIRNGSLEERVMAFSIYSTDVHMKDMPLNPEYHPILLDLLAKDDMKVAAYTNRLVWTLKFEYPSRETLFAFMDAAKRAPTYEDRKGILFSAAYLCGIDWHSMNPVPRGPQVDKTLSDFESWFAQNKDRIQFTKKGEFRLAGSKGHVERPELNAEDRGRIRQDPVCVLSLMNMTMGREGDDVPEAIALNSQCGAALFGAEGAKAYGAALSEGQGGGEPSLESRINLSSLAGVYPAIDAGILAAVYIAGYDSDPAHLEMAKDTLIQVGPADVKRVAKGEPGPVVKKAQALANSDRQSAKD